MEIDAKVLDNLSERAKGSERLRMNLDLRNSAADGSQRMLNALEPGTVVPIHRHRGTSETVAVLRGAVRENFYDESGKLAESFVVAAGGVDVTEFVDPPLGRADSLGVVSGGSSDGGALDSVGYAGAGCPFFVVPKGVWHNTECLVSGTVFFEAKDGAYEPMREVDVMNERG